MAQNPIVGKGANDYLWKPQGENTGTGTILPPAQYTGQIDNIQLVDADGNVVDTAEYRHDYEDGRTIWDTNKPGGAYGVDTQVQITLDNGEVIYYPGGGSGRQDGAGPVGQGSVSGGGDSPGGFAGGGSSGVAALPAYLGGQYPVFNPVDFPTIDPAKFNFTDPQKFAAEFGEFNRGEFAKNFQQSKDFALGALETELSGLKSFAPAASALKRQETSLDNQFNQFQRSRQVDTALPGVRGDLNAQRNRATAYTEGRLPDANLDRSLELGIRSRAADQAGFSGIGTASQQADKLSDLMSAETRLQISQYGEGLLGENIATKANLLLAPTEYSDAGTQLRVTPEVGAGRLTYQGAQMLNAATLLDPAQALTSKIQQEQFTTQIEQRTNEFNATGVFDASKFNSAGAFTAALGKFQYDVAFQNAITAANQANLNAAFGVSSQGVQNDNSSSSFNDAQSAQTIQAVTQGIGAIPGAINSVSSVLGSSAPVESSQTAPKSLAATPGIDTSPSTSSSTPTSTLQAPTIRTSAPPQAVSADASTPSAYKFSQGVQVPQGYTPTARNNDGTYSAARTSDYDQELNRFAARNNVPRGSVTVQNAAASDRAVTGATGLSYLPIPGFQPMAMSTGGRPIYSLPAAANSGNVQAGQNNMTNLAVALATLGSVDPAMLGAISHIGSQASDVDFLNHIDETSLEKGPEGVAAELIRGVVGDKPDPSTPEGQQALMIADKIGQVWGGLSPHQKSMAITALAKPALKIKTGRDVADDAIPGTDKAVGGKLTVGEATSFTAQGINGHALARNWNQLSAFGHMATGSKDKGIAARLAGHTGLLGFGIQGSAVPVESGHLRRVGAEPAPELGIGAANFSSANHVPKNYKIVSSTPKGGVVAVPANLLHTTPMGTGGPSPLAFKKVTQVASGRHPTQKLWGKAPGGRVIRGADGGSAIVSGLEVMKKANPDLYSSVLAHSLFNNTMGG